MGRDAFAWSAFLALLCGLLAGLGKLRSVGRAFGVAVALMLWQVAFWTVFLAFGGTDGQITDGDWNPDLLAVFFLSLLAVVPYTTIGAVLSATAVALARRFGQRQTR